MIQRIQSLYLLLACLVLASIFFFEAVWPGGATDVPGWTPGALVVTALLAVLTAVWAILLYNDRKRQHKVVLYSQLATLATIAALVFGFWQSGELTPLLDGPGGTGKVVTLALPFLAYVLLFMARKAIERDIELVRSMDRLR